MAEPGPGKLRVGFYGDDFAGSTDVMEALSLAGIKTRLFLRPPSPGDLKAEEGLGAVGIAGMTRTLGPDALEAELRPAFQALKGLGAPLVHYKISPTFESSPQLGSIGRACDLGRAEFGSAFVPLLAAAPPLGRYSVFGNLFARSGQDGSVFRLDRYPPASQHPATPMDEGDLLRHLSKQTSQSVALFDILKLQGAEAVVEERFQEVLASEPDIVLFDALLETHMARIGGLLWKACVKEGPLFAVGSSGLEYALNAFWRQAQPQAPSPAYPGVGAADKMVVISGSFSPVTARQIQGATGKGFLGLALDPLKLLSEEKQEAEKASVPALKALGAGKSVVLHTALGPTDARVKASAGALKGEGTARLGAALGRLLAGLLTGSGTKRAVVAGGDCSGFVAKELGIQSLTMAGPIIPGAPLCRASIPGAKLDGLEILFKEGQTGKDEVFDQILKGKA